MLGKVFVGPNAQEFDIGQEPSPITGVTLKASIPKDVIPGYTRLEYIESTGTQYIDAGFAPSSETEIIADFEISSGNEEWAGIFGSETASNDFADAFCLWISPQGFRDDYYDSSVTLSKTNTGRTKIRKKGNVTRINTDTVKHTETEFKSVEEFLIFAIQTGGVTDPRLLKAKLYSFKVYDFGEKILDLVPCKSEGGDIGLYDLVTGSFYYNVGTGEFIEGAEWASSGNGGESSVVYTSGDGAGRVIEKECPWGTQEMAGSILTATKNIRYIPFNAQDVLLDPAAEIGDGIIIGGVYSIFAGSSITFDKMCLANVFAPSSDDLDDEYPYLTADKRQLDKIEKAIENLENKVDESYDRMDDIITGSGVISFNGRDGVVVPEIGDYTDEISEAIKYAIYESWEAKY